MPGSAPAGLSAPYTTGVVLGTLALVPHFVLAERASIAYATILLGVIAGIYVGFALQKGSINQAIVEIAAAIIFALMALLGATVSIWFVPLVYGLHGFWDLAHHGRKNGDEVFVRVPRWYPPFCAVVDWVVAVGLVVIWWRNGIL